MKANPADFDYIMYVDASGDDGFKFETGSTSCYSAAALLVKQCDVEYNLSILEQIKQIVGCKAQDEVKYSKVRRHRRGDEALSLLKNLHGQISSYVVFKKEVDKSRYVGNKSMSIICHYMALTSFDFFNISTDQKVLITIDRMKQTEEEPLSLIWSQRAEQIPSRSNVSVIFRDSKDKNFLLIQIADLLAGILREHFEKYETNIDMRYFADICPKCKLLSSLKHMRKPYCKNGRSRRQHITDSTAIKYILHLIPQCGTFNMLYFIYVEPSSMVSQVQYMACPRI